MDVERARDIAAFTLAQRRTHDAVRQQPEVRATGGGQPQSAPLQRRWRDLGKPPGTDLRDGVYTLPLLYAVETEPSLADQLGTPQPDVDLIRKTVVRTGAFQRALDVAAEHVDEALTCLDGAPEGPARHSLERFTRLIIDRVPVLE